jgi:hypothetical protein
MGICKYNTNVSRVYEVDGICGINAMRQQRRCMTIVNDGCENEDKKYSGHMGIIG